jgi:hypothetical protein
VEYAYAAIKTAAGRRKQLTEVWPIELSLSALKSLVYIAGQTTALLQNCGLRDGKRAVAQLRTARSMRRVSK